MNMKKFVKKPLVIAVLMLASGGVVNMAHADTKLHGQDVVAKKAVKKGGVFGVELKASDNEIVSGKTTKAENVFYMVMTDPEDHKGWNVWPTGVSKGGQMSLEDGSHKVDLHTNNLTWAKDHWMINDSSERVEASFFVNAGNLLKPGEYVFSAYVEDFVN
ncbi:MyfA/PsaA family fimbrial adhesin [Yersinia kristensenii]|uniref:MyfA/PsaA family fimbrial adhesin n=1 Tax=Yersinia kristensenii TaxID=28152 RepID=UPI0022FE07D7|nr:MyfA/PsaA family fimbrial adhesin [Yersinia kristensenii]MDA5487658.1 MyfA/PsaA family fimbrial adhesin [Yersinia kristensenii]